MTGRNDPEVVAEAKELFVDNIPGLADAIFLSEVVRILRPLQDKYPAVYRFMEAHNLMEIYPTLGRGNVMVKKTSSDREFQFASSAEADKVAFHTEDISEWDAANRYVSDKNK